MRNKWRKNISNKKEAESQVEQEKVQPSTSQQPSKPVKGPFTIAEFIIPIRGEEDESKILHCNYISRGTNPHVAHDDDSEDEGNNDPMEEIPLDYGDDGHISDNNWTS